MEAEELQEPSEDTLITPDLENSQEFSKNLHSKDVQCAIEIVDVKSEPPDMDGNLRSHENVAISSVEIESSEKVIYVSAKPLKAVNTENVHNDSQNVNDSGSVSKLEDSVTFDPKFGEFRTVDPKDGLLGSVFIRPGATIKEESQVEVKQEVEPDDMMCEPDINISYDVTSPIEGEDLRNSLQEEVQLKLEVVDNDYESEGQRVEDIADVNIKSESETLDNKTNKATTDMEQNTGSDSKKYTEICKIRLQTQYPTENNKELKDYEDDSNFLLNSITGDMLTLEQEAYGLLKAKNSKMISEKNKVECPKCPGLFKPESLPRHLKVHETIERRKEGVARGLQTKAKNRELNLAKIGTSKDLQTIPYYYKDNVEKKGEFSCNKCGKAYRMLGCLNRHQENCKLRKVKRAMLGEQKFLNTKIKALEEDPKNKVKNRIRNKLSKEVKALPLRNVPVKKGSGEYTCECGNKFSRRSRMETCLRSHNPEEYTRSFSCTTCAKSFKQKNELTLHRKRVHTKKKFLCKFCPMDYATPKELFKHLRVHKKVQMMEYKAISEVVEGKETLKCFICKKTSAELSELKEHVLVDHKEPYKCPQCGKNFPKIVDFATHTKSAHPEVEGKSVLDVLEAFSILAEAWKCEACELQFEDPDKLVKHQTEQHGPISSKPESGEECQKFKFRCDDCRRTFVTLKQLSTHRASYHTVKNGISEEPERIPTPPPPRPMCVHCRKICQDEASLTSHLRLHSMERKYPCKFCDFRFTTFEKRRTHALIHTGDMKFVCFICEYRCSSENRLNFHKKSQKHLDLKQMLLDGPPLEPVILPVAKKKRESTEVLSEAFSDSSDDPASTCDVCGEEFSSERAMKKHKETHPFIVFPNEEQPTRIFFK